MQFSHDWVPHKPDPRVSTATYIFADSFLGEVRNVDYITHDSLKLFKIIFSAFPSPQSLSIYNSDLLSLISPFLPPSSPAYRFRTEGLNSTFSLINVRGVNILFLSS